jgi:class 3 adenylate cyclase
MELDVAAWLRGLGLERYEQAFRESDIDAEVLPKLAAEDLTGLGITSIGHRRKLLVAIAALRTDSLAAEPTMTSLLPEAERRQVTVLFADLCGYTRLSRELDAEEVHALLEEFFGLADDIVRRCGGTVDKHIGDCVMAVFGAPIAYGNDPERAVRAALEIQNRLPGLGQKVSRAVAVHIGVASGQVVASGTGSTSHREYTVTGELVNLASRLTDQAVPGEILISEAVRRRSRSFAA